MITSKVEKSREAFVWIWLPTHLEPIICGKLTLDEGIIVLNYARSYLENPNKMALFELELPLIQGIQYPIAGLTMPSCIRDGSPDAWGRRVIINRKFGVKKNDFGTPT